MYVYINNLNISSVDSRETRSRARARAGAGPKSGPKEPGVVELGLLRALLPCAIASLRVKSLPGSLGAAKPHRRFL